MKSICGADCENCGYGKSANCKGCESSSGCPFGKPCFIAKYIRTGGIENYNTFKNQLIDEFNSLNIEGMPKITELYALNGSFVNLAYPMPCGHEIKLLDDDQIYLGTQVECEFNDENKTNCFGLIAGMDFLLVSEYGADCANAQIVIFKRR